MRCPSIISVIIFINISFPPKRKSHFNSTHSKYLSAKRRNSLITKSYTVLRGNYTPAMRLSHCWIKLVNIWSPGARAAPVSKAALAVWYSSRLKHAVLWKEIQSRVIKGYTKWNCIIMHDIGVTWAVHTNDWYEWRGKIHWHAK